MLNNREDFLSCKDCAFYYINRRRYTKKEIVDKLLKKDYDLSVSNEVVDYLEEAGYLDDSDYARRFILDSVKLKKHGFLRIKRGLIEKGISELIIEDVYNKLDLDVKSVLLSLIESKSVNLDLNDRKQYEKLYAFLLRRGFSYNEINDALGNRHFEKENF